jgi:hypothetical protein
MASTITPSNQTVYLDPYTAKMFDFNSTDSRVYLSRAINNLYKASGDDCILNGLQITDVTISSNIVQALISPGKAIVDSTLLEFTDPIMVDLDVSAYDDANGYLVINLAYQYLHTVYSNLSKVKLSYVVEGGDSVYPLGTWFRSRDRLIIGMMSFDKTAQTVTNTTPAPLDRPVFKTILGDSYQIAEPDYTIKRIQETMYPPGS